MVLFTSRQKQQNVTYSSLQLLIQPWIYVPGTHYLWLDSVEAVWNAIQCIQCLSETYKHDQQWDSNPRCSDI